MAAVVHFIGLLANVDETILDFPLDDGLRIERLELGLFRGLERGFGDQGIEDAMRRHHGTLYQVRKDYEVPGVKLYRDTAQRIEKIKLDMTFRLMRLLKPGNACLVGEFYITSSGTEKYLGSYSSPFHYYVDSGILSLDKEDIAPIRQFIQGIFHGLSGKSEDETEGNYRHKEKHPLALPACNLAFENFELSFSAPSDSLAFLAVMTAMEVLFNAGAHRVARNAAVLLGKDRADSTTIFNELKSLHNKRSGFLHSGDSTRIDRQDLMQLRDYCRRSIVRVHQIGLPKERLLEALNTMGFGDVPDLLESSPA